MHGLAAGRLGRRDERGNAEVALGGGRRADPHRPVGEPDVERVFVRRRVHGDGLDAELVQGADHTDGDLSPVRDEDAVEHGRSLARQRCGERAGAAAQHGLAVRDEDARHRQLQERRERLAQVVVRRLPEPAFRAEPQRRTRVARLRAGAEEDVADDHRSLPWQPVDDLPGRAVSNAWIPPGSGSPDVNG